MLESDFLVPWGPNGVPWNEPDASNKEFEFRPNEPFKAALKVEQIFQKSTSTIVAVMYDQATGHRFYMRIQDFHDAILSTAPVFGVFVGVWRFRKSSNRCYGLEYLGKE